MSGSSTHDNFIARAMTRGLTAYARVIVARPGAVLLTIGLLLLGSLYLTLKLTIEPNQLDLISQELPEVKRLKRIIDMVGGAGYLTMALRADDEKTLKDVSDDLYKVFTAEPENVRFITHKVPVEFIQDNMVLFIETADLVEAKKRISAYLKDQLRRNNPFFVEIRKTEPVKLDLTDLVDKYSHIGKKSIRDDYYISDDHKMQLLLIKPMWNSTELPKTKAYLAHMKELIDAYAQKKGIRLEEEYTKLGNKEVVYYGFTGSYKTALDDSYAIEDSLNRVLLLALGLIAAVTFLFFRRVAPSVIVIVGTVIGTVLTMGFAWLTLGQLNMITSMIAAVLMGFGIDYGIHFTFRTRIELGMGKRYDEAIRDAVVNAGRPASVAAIVTGGSFMVLMVSEFRGFSQFGFLAGFGTLIIGVTLFTFCAAVLSLAGRVNPLLPERLVGTMTPRSLGADGSGQLRIPRPGLVLAICVAVVGAVCAFAIPWQDFPLPKDREPTLWERFKGGIRFDYNTRALMPDWYTSIVLQDEINRRFQISSDPIAVYSKDLAEVREVYDELTLHKEKYSSVDQVVSIYSFVPPAKTAEANAKVLAEWKEELKDLEVASLPPELQEKAERFMRILSAKPYTAEELPKTYTEMFVNMPTTRPENRGYLTFLYPGVDLWDGRKVLEFADQTANFKTASGKEFHGDGLPILYATLARIVLWDGKITVLLATLWILLMHYLDFRSAKLAAASVIPLGVGLLMMLGVFSITNQRLNFMNIVILPILLGFGVSHGLYLLHRFLEGTSPLVALRSVGAAVASSTLTAIAGFGSLLVAGHNGLRSVGIIACVGLATTLIVSFTVLAAVLELIHEQRIKVQAPGVAPASEKPAA